MNGVAHDSRRMVGTWLLVCCVAVFAMVLLGGVTRLSGSGLSMVEWKPITGLLPPVTQTEWEAQFQLYQQSPEFRLKNSHMDLDGFKSIFWMEYLHRLLGRAIGVIFLLPLIYFAVTRRVGRGYLPRLLFMFLLGGLQGLLGWYMVKSGLVNDPHVSQYRLTAHLGLAFLIFALIFWSALDLFYPRATVMERGDRGLRWLSSVVSIVVFLAVLSGGLMAGTKAGLAYNSFPLMDGQLIPEGLLTLKPVWVNPFENVTTIQFDHRLFALLQFLLVSLCCFLALRRPIERRLRIGCYLLLLVLLIQITLGVATLLARVPLPLAAAHQGTALLLFTLTLYLNQGLLRRNPAG
ncbi:MAG: COX15/CtaA family protein [Gammaproteobacteria bacterium]|nr:COX15/CtaA family protein [Gammaproteobacteria bacterium]